MRDGLSRRAAGIHSDSSSDTNHTRRYEAQRNSDGCSAQLGSVVMFQSYHHFSSGASFFQITHGLGDFGERVSPVDHWCDLPGFDELPHDDHVLVVLLVDERAQLLAHERR